MNNNKKMIAQSTSVTADAEQPFNKSSNNIINENAFDCKLSDKIIANIRSQVSRNLDASYMKTVSMSELLDNVYEAKPPLIENLLYPGTYLFVGAPKLGKSFMMAQIAYHISSGIPIWNYAVTKGTVLYLALEDDYKRLQERLYRMFKTEGNENLFFSISANQLGNGLDEQLKRFISEHSNTSLIIIDTLQKIRELAGDKYSYASDYEIITRLKKFSDCYGICLLLVHHTRKQNSDDKFDMISGTNGLLGAADGAFLLRKEKRTNNNAILEVSGRDQQDQRLYITKNTETLAWELERAETELWDIPPEPILDEIAKYITTENPIWKGTPTELCEFIGVDIKPNVLTLKLNVNASILLKKFGIKYKNIRRHDGRKIELIKQA